MTLFWQAICLWAMAAAVIVLGLAGCSGGGSPGPTVPPKAPQAAGAKPAAPAPAPEAKAPAFAYDVRGRRDPFRPLIAARTEGRSRPKTGLAVLEVSELKLSGIVWEQRGYYALVEAPNGAGYVLRVNDTVGESARVAKITPQAVTFEIKARARPAQPAPAREVVLQLRKEE